VNCNPFIEAEKGLAGAAGVRCGSTGLWRAGYGGAGLRIARAPLPPGSPLLGSSHSCTGH